MELIKTVQQAQWDEAGLSHSHPFPGDCRATSATADRNKENIPSSSRISTEQDIEMEARECPGGQSERTPRPRKWKHSPTLVQFAGNQGTHAVSHRSFSPCPTLSARHSGAVRRCDCSLYLVHQFLFSLANQAANRILLLRSLTS